MNLLFLDSYFEPETIAYTHLEKDLLEGLVKGNNRVQIICPTPTRGVSEQIREEYKERKNEKLYGGKVKVRRFWAPQEGKNPIVRAFRYFWCNIRSYQIAMRAKNVGIVFSNSTPPTQGMLSTMVSKKLSKKYKKKVSFIYNLQDIFPDSLVNTGMTKKGGFLWKVGRKIENYTYKNADRIIVISEGFKRNIMDKGVPGDKIEVISNWIDLESVYPVSRDENKLVKEFGINPKKFLVVYAGNFGATQGADIVLKAAAKLQDVTNMQFIIFGGGAYFEEAKKEAERLDNVFIHELLPQDRISEIYSLGDVALITCKLGTGNAGMPSKTWSIMACNTPIIASFDTNSDLSEVLRVSCAGICVKPSDIDALTDAIKEKYHSSWKDTDKHRDDIRKYVHENVSKEVCVNRYIETLKKQYYK